MDLRTTTAISVQIFLLIRRDCVVGQELKEKEYYKQMIIDLISKVDNVAMLAYLYRLVSNIVKAGN